MRNDAAAFQSDLERMTARFPILKQRLRQPAGTLSGGEQQMLVIARALLTAPSLLMLDEPSLGLAPLIVAEIFRLIRELNSEGMTILLVEQNARQALHISNRAYVMETGKVVLEGADLADDPRVRNAYLGV
jgi:branched-chain amino acid transport system ATP-binding protein